MARSQARRLVFVLFEDCLLLDFAGPLQAFELACENAEAGRAPYVWQICSLKGGPVRTSSGLEVMTTSLADCDLTDIDTLIVGSSCLGRGRTGRLVSSGGAEREARLLGLYRHLCPGCSRPASWATRRHPLGLL